MSKVSELLPASPCPGAQATHGQRWGIHELLRLQGAHAPRFSYPWVTPLRLPRRPHPPRRPPLSELSQGADSSVGRKVHLPAAGQVGALRHRLWVEAWPKSQGNEAAEVWSHPSLTHLPTASAPILVMQRSCSHHRLAETEIQPLVLHWRKLRPRQEEERQL